MSKKYKAAMDKITVTEELREKIIKSASEGKRIEFTEESREKIVKSPSGKEKVEFTEELKEKIIKNASEREKSISDKKDLGNISPGEIIKNTSHRYPYFAKFGVGIAACLLVAVSLFAGRYMLVPDTSKDPYVYNMQGVEFFKSTEEIEKYLGYTFKMPKYLPEGYTMDSCRVIGDSLIEISYTNNESSLIYRTEKTTDNISGDYNQYENTEVEAVGGCSVTLNSTEGVYYNAVWNDDGFSYSLSGEKGIDKETIIKIIRSVA